VQGSRSLTLRSMRSEWEEFETDSDGVPELVDDQLEDFGGWQESASASYNVMAGGGDSVQTEWADMPAVVSDGYYGYREEDISSCCGDSEISDGYAGDIEKEEYDGGSDGVKVVNNDLGFGYPGSFKCFNHLAAKNQSSLGAQPSSGAYPFVTFVDSESTAEQGGVRLRAQEDGGGA
jgi:hypothetical protein